MKNKIFLVALMLLPLAMLAQKQKPAFHSSIASGLLVGQSNPSGVVETINGIRIGNWTAGLGAGIDWYRQLSVPLFASVQRNFTAKHQEFFVYANGGYNMLWMNDVMKQAFVDSDGGLYYDVGIGHQMPVFKKHKLFVSLGYTGKQYSLKEQPNFWWIDPGGIGPDGHEPTTYTYKHSLRRINLKIGLRL